MILLDTNILLRSKHIQSSQYEEVTSKLVDLLYQGNILAVATQSIYEFYTVATRPINVNGLGLNKEVCLQEIQDIITTYELLLENEHLFNYWKNLTQSYEIQGKASHDARLVAIMQAYQIKRIYTLNGKDFRKFNDIIEIIE